MVACPRCSSAADISVFGERKILCVERCRDSEPTEYAVVGWGPKLGAWHALCHTCGHKWRVRPTPEEGVPRRVSPARLLRSLWRRVRFWNK